MSISARAIVVAVVCNLWACTTSTQAPPTPAPALEPAAAPQAAYTPDETADFAAVRVIAPTPEMLKAALANDPDAMRDAAATQSTCQATTTCPAQFSSCTSWSTTTQCGSTCGPGVCICKPVRDCDPGDPGVPRGTNSFNSFRICFDSSQNACTQWSLTTSTFCGC
jgi:hypothetical protein